MTPKERAEARFKCETLVSYAEANFSPSEANKVRAVAGPAVRALNDLDDADDVLKQERLEKEYIDLLAEKRLIRIRDLKEALKWGKELMLELHPGSPDEPCLYQEWYYLVDELIDQKEE